MIFWVKHDDFENSLQTSSLSGEFLLATPEVCKIGLWELHYQNVSNPQCLKRHTPPWGTETGGKIRIFFALVFFRSLVLFQWTNRVFKNSTFRAVSNAGNPVFYFFIALIEGVLAHLTHRRGHLAFYFDINSASFLWLIPWPGCRSNIPGVSLDPGDRPGPFWGIGLAMVKALALCR